MFCATYFLVAAGSPNQGSKEEQSSAGKIRTSEEPKLQTLDGQDKAEPEAMENGPPVFCAAYFFVGGV